MLGVVQEITERVEAAAALKRGARQYREILESITDAFFSLDAEMRITYYTELLGEIGPPGSHNQLPHMDLCLKPRPIVIKLYPCKLK
jgi:hypothetical protein